MRIFFQGLREYSTFLSRAPKRLEARVAQNLDRAGRLVEGGTERRIGTGSVLGSVTGETRRSINRRHFKRGRRQFMVVGPHGNRKANLLRIHEEGLRVTNPARQYPVRRTLGAAVDSTASQVEALLGTSFDVL